MQAVIQGHNKHKCSLCLGQVGDKKTIRRSHWVLVPGIQPIPARLVGVVIGKRGAVTKEINQGCQRQGATRIHLEPGEAFGHVHAHRGVCLQDITMIQRRYRAKIDQALSYVLGQQAQGVEQARVFLQQKRDKNRTEMRVDRWVEMRVSTVQRKVVAIGKYESTVREYTNVDEVMKMRAKVEAGKFECKFNDGDRSNILNQCDDVMSSLREIHGGGTKEREDIFGGTAAVDQRYQVDGFGNKKMGRWGAKHDRGLLPIQRRNKWIRRSGAKGLALGIDMKNCHPSIAIWMMDQSRLGEFPQMIQQAVNPDVLINGILERTDKVSRGGQSC